MFAAQRQIEPRGCGHAGSVVDRTVPSEAESLFLRLLSSNAAAASPKRLPRLRSHGRNSRKRGDRRQRPRPTCTLPEVWLAYTRRQAVDGPRQTRALELPITSWPTRVAQAVLEGGRRSATRASNTSHGKVQVARTRHGMRDAVLGRPQRWRAHDDSSRLLGFGHFLMPRTPGYICFVVRALPSTVSACRRT